MSGAKVVIGAVGVMCFADHHLCAGFGVGSKIAKHGADFPFLHVRQILGQATVLFGNLESAVGTPQAPSSAKCPSFCSAPEAVAALGSLGFDVVNLANNHSLQYGNAGFNSGRTVLEDHNVHAIGIAATEGRLSTHPAYLDRNGMIIGIVGFSIIPENYFPASWSYTRPSVQEALETISLVAAEVDHLVVSCHWGLELSDAPTAGLIGLARAMVDGGARIVLGHHPHVWQGVEEYREGIIFHSLGDFVFDLAWCQPCRRTGIAMITLNSRGIDGWRVEPVLINANWQPEPMKGRSRAEFLTKLVRLSREVTDTPGGTPDARISRDFEVGVRDRVAANQRRKRFHVLKNMFRLGPRRFFDITVKQLQD